MKKRRSLRKIGSMLLACLLVFQAVPGAFGTSVSEQPGFVSMAAAPEAAVSENIGRHDYERYAASTVNSYLYQRGEELIRVEGLRDAVTVETYDRAFRLKDVKVLQKELPLFGGFFEGADYNFLVFGGVNGGEKDVTEVIRIVKYSKDWTRRIGDGSYRGLNTVIPFDSGSLRMAEINGVLYLRTAHLMYTTSDDLNHQASMMLTVRESDLRLLESFHGIGGKAYTSHSFNQFVMVDSDSNLVTLDHGDAYPRSIVLGRFQGTAGEEQLGRNYEELEIFPFYGGIGENRTGAALGGLAESGSSYLAAGSSVPQDRADFPGLARNVFLTVTDKEEFSEEETKTVWLSDYEDTGSDSAAAPYLIKLSEDRFLVLWERLTDGKGGVLEAVFVNGEGETVSSVMTDKGNLSDCEPLIAGEELLWYVTNGTLPVFYRMNLQTGKLVKTGVFEDVDPGAWYDDAVNFVAEQGIMAGTGGMKFEPTANLTRAMMVQILHNLEGNQEVWSTYEYRDVPEGSWFERAVVWADAYHIVAGTGNDQFSPNKMITREEMAVMLKNYCAYYKEIDLPATRPALSFSDNGEISSWAREAVEMMYRGEVLSGKGSNRFGPKENATRAEVAQMFKNFMEVTG